MIVMVKSSVNGARKERMTIMDTATCVKWTLNVTMLAKPNCYNMQRGRSILNLLSTCKVLSKANCYSVSQASGSSQGGPSSSQGGPSSSQGGPSSCQSEHGEATQEQNLSTSKSSSVATLSGFVYYDDALLKAEIYWLAKVACSNCSLHSYDHVGDMFRAMFPDSKIAAHFSLSHTSSSYIISEGLSSYFTKVIIDDLQRSKLPFSIHFDETSTSQVKKQMDLTLRYWFS